MVILSDVPTISTRRKAAHKPPSKLGWGLAIGLPIGLICGYFAGREHLKWEMASALQSAANAIVGEVGTKDSTRSTPPSNSVQKRSPLVVTSWSYFAGEDELQEYYSITITLENRGQKGIKLVDGSLDFYDLLDKYLYGIELPRDMEIPAGERFVSTGRYAINSFASSAGRMKQMDKTDIRAKLSIAKLVYDNNAVESFEQP